MGFFKSDNSFIYLDGCETCEFYIPISYFTDKPTFALYDGTDISVLGVFDVSFFDAKGALIASHILNVPSMITIHVYDSEDREVKLPSEDAPVPCRVVTYHKGAKIMLSSVIEDSSNVMEYLSFIIKGKLPKSVPYSKSLEIWRKNAELNSSSLEVPSVILEMILSVCYRDKNNTNNKFAYVASDPGTSDYGYIMNSIRQICENSSTYVAITFEDIDRMITSSLNNTAKKVKEDQAPTEILLKL